MPRARSRSCGSRSSRVRALFRAPSESIDRRLLSRSASYSSVRSLEMLVVLAVERQQNLKLGMARPAVHFDQTFVLLHEGLRERETETAAVLAPRHERIENAVANLFGNAWAV